MTSELRQYQRKLFKTTVKIQIEQDSQVYEAKSQNISVDGICVVIRGKNIPKGKICKLMFDIWIQGKTRTIITTAKVVYSICSKEGFKIGMQYIHMDAGGVAVIEALLLSK